MIRRARAGRYAIPKAIAEAPTLLPGLGFYYSAFLSLSSCRASGFGEGRIPWTAVREYGKSMDMTESELEDLWLVISVMDGAYLSYRAEQAKK